MKNLITIFILLLTILTSTKQSAYISIEHIGISDKPIPTILISKNKVVRAGNESFMVRNENYAVLKELMLSNTKADYKGGEFVSVLPSTS